MPETRARPGSGRTAAAAAAFLLLLAAGSAPADDFVPGVYGTPLPPGSRVQGSIDASAGEDADDHVVLLERGRTLTAVVGSPRSKELAPPTVELPRPDGSVALTAPGTGTRRRLRFTADATGAYRLRVRGGADTVAAYTVTVAVAGPLTTTARDVAPDGEGVLRFLVPARGGAVVTAKLRHRGGAPTPRSLTSPAGIPVPGALPEFRTRRGGVTLAGFEIPEDLRFGDYEFAFDTDPGEPPTSVSFTATVKLPRTRPLRARLGPEPSLGTLTPDFGVVAGEFRVVAAHAEDPAGAPYVVRVGGVVAQAGAVPGEPSQIRVTIPTSLPLGVHDVSLHTSTGQTAVLPSAFTLVPRPVASSFDPQVVPARGGATVTISGTGFRPGRMGVLIAGQVTPIVPSATTATSVAFVVPEMPPGTYRIGVFDRDLGVQAEVGAGELRWAPWAWIGDVTPPLVSVLGGDPVGVEGAYFADDDKVWLETAQEGVFEQVQPTTRTATLLTFTAPVRPRGVYDLYVEDAEGAASPVRTLTYFSFADATARLGLSSAGAFDPVSTALADFDGDGDLDLALTRRLTGAAASSSATRLLRNDGASGLTDVTASVLPDATAADDWRGDVLRAADVTGDGRPDLVVTTHDTTVPAAGRSATRLLVNEARAAGAAATDRVFRDRTQDLMAPTRAMTSLYGSTRTNERDDWRGLDLWIGDLDGVGGPPELVVTTDRTYENLYVSCTPYCASPYGGGYSYSFYWGGTRVFRWDAQARSGLGRYAFDRFRMPQRAGLNVQISPNFDVTCRDAHPCRAAFTPFTGKRLAVGRIDDDARPDLAVVGTSQPTVEGSSVSALQVALWRDASPTHWRVLDVTPALTTLGADFRGDAVAVSAAAWPGGAGGGLLAVARATQGSGPALRLLTYEPGADAVTVGTFTDRTASLLPAPSGAESWQADALAFHDLDADGDVDLVALSAAAPGLRLLRNVGTPSGGGPFAQAFAPLVAAASGDAFPGDALALGDVDGNGLVDFVVSRSSAGGGAHLRGMATER